MKLFISIFTLFFAVSNLSSSPTCNVNVPISGKTFKINNYCNPTDVVVGLSISGRIGKPDADNNCKFAFSLRCLKLKPVFEITHLDRRYQTESQEPIIFNLISTNELTMNFIPRKGASGDFEIEENISFPKELLNYFKKNKIEILAGKYSVKYNSDGTAIVKFRVITN